MRGDIDGFNGSGLRISWARGTQHETMGLAAGDTVVLVQNVAVQSDAHVARLSTKLRLEVPDTVSVGVLRDGCPLWMNWRIP